ncbi:MAG: double zinc ribbon domain-containing protein, partial [Candidatus Hodarchaeales archaeon]
IDFSVDYRAEDVQDFSSAPIVIENVNEPTSGTYTVPNDGYWYFFIYFDPFKNPDEKVEITFDVSYDTGITSVDRWQDLRPVLTFLAIVIIILIIIAIIQRRSAKKRQQTVTAAATTSATPSGEISTTSTAPNQKVGECHRCKYPYKPGDVYCTNCGAKLVGRDYGSSDITTPASSKKCKSCGNELLPDSKFCKYCGAKVVTNKGYSYFPDERKSFFCQLDGQKHPSTDSAYQCDQCSRMICSECYDNASSAGVTKCPYCQGHLTKIQ